jgi:hypothetical protein
MKSSDQALRLLEKMRSAISGFNFSDNFKKQITEPEIMLRYSAIDGFLMVFLNDLGGMYREWVNEERKQLIKDSAQNLPTTPAMPVSGSPSTQTGEAPASA